METKIYNFDYALADPARQEALQKILSDKLKESTNGDSIWAEEFVGNLNFEIHTLELEGEKLCHLFYDLPCFEVTHSCHNILINLKFNGREYPITGAVLAAAERLVAIIKADHERSIKIHKAYDEGKMLAWYETLRPFIEEDLGGLMQLARPYVKLKLPGPELGSWQQYELTCLEIDRIRLKRQLQGLVNNFGLSSRKLETLFSDAIWATTEAPEVKFDE